MSSATTAANPQPLRRGDVVELRPPPEILATLDADASLDAVPFMPEMLQYAGRRMTISHRVEKFCDTISSTGSRRMRDTVYLDDLRCDGSGHGGCQAGCRIYWKEAWLRRVDDSGATAKNGAAIAARADAELEDLAMKRPARCANWRASRQTSGAARPPKPSSATTQLKTSGSAPVLA